MKQVQLRLPDDLAERVAERAARHKMSRHQWILLALERVVSMPSQVTQQQVRF